jgi:hypothetical protein
MHDFTALGRLPSGPAKAYFGQRSSGWTATHRELTLKLCVLQFSGLWEGVGAIITSALNVEPNMPAGITTIWHAFCAAQQRLRLALLRWHCWQS